MWRVERTLPSPPQFVHGFGIRCPVPPHATHGTAVTSCPRIDRRTWRTSPAPSQESQRVGCVPGSHPDPSQRSHPLGNRSSRVCVVPNAASDRSSSISASASGARGGPAAPPAKPPEKNASKRSPNPNASPGPWLAPLGPAVVAEHVEATPPLRIPQRLVGAGDLLEACFHGRVGVRVGVQLACELAIGALDLVVGGVRGDAEQRVGISGHRATQPSRSRPSCCDTAATAASACW